MQMLKMAARYNYLRSSMPCGKAIGRIPDHDGLHKWIYDSVYIFCIHQSKKTENKKRNQLSIQSEVTKGF
jgi:hypothetical protein